MAKVKYRIREFTPAQNQPGNHSVYAQAVIDFIAGMTDPYAERAFRELLGC